MAAAQKIKTIEELAALLEAARGRGSRIVQCHGVFDLLHIGHIKHLVAARALGDVLVVTITPDHLVNKGPHRPAFPERLRAEALAALGCVDYVAINRWPTAVELIQLLKPHVFVKGMSKDAGPRDHTGAILKEEEAVRSVGGVVHFTDEETFSASMLINRHLDLFAPAVRGFLDAFRTRFSEGDIVGFLQKIRDLKVLVIGETIIDEYHFCSVMNKACKDPILAARFLSAEKYVGGVQAIASHLANFANEVHVLSYLGARDSQEVFVRGAVAPNIREHFFAKTDAPTIVKRRYLEEYMSVKLLEVDDMNDTPLNDADDAVFCGLIEDLVPQFDAVIVADYGHGLLSDRALRLICDKARFLALNTQANPGNYGFNVVSKYPRADFVLIDEIEARLEMRKQEVGIDSIMRILAEKMGCKVFMVTRGQNGTVCYDAQAGYFHTPVLSVKVVDRIGAGDACLALTAPCAAMGIPSEALGFICNVAGAAACGIMGNKAAIDAASLFRHISSILK